jgi:immune inhibitor A
MYVQRPDAIARDAVLAFAATATSPADRAALARAESLLVFFAGAGRESHTASGDPTDPWSNYTALVPAVAVPDGPRFDEAIVIAEREVRPFSSFGVLCHEFGHLLGLPELYAPGGLPQEGIGVWGLMGQGTWLRRGERPPHPCAWSKTKLGWVDVDTIESSRRGVELPAVERVPRVVKIPIGRHEYYLLENRARVGADRALPGAGLLVWHVDERVGGFRTGQVNAAHKFLHLVDADGRRDLDRGHAAGGNRGDATDPWVGPPRWRRTVAAALLFTGALLVAAAVFRMVRPRPFVPVIALVLVAAAAIGAGRRLGRTPVCGPATPGMAPYDGGLGRVSIRNISPAGSVMRFDVLIAPVAD